MVSQAGCRTVPTAGCVVPYLSQPRFHSNSAFFGLMQVEGEIQGEDNLVQKLLQDVNKGPRYARVVKLEKSDIETTEGESAFTVRK